LGEDTGGGEGGEKGAAEHAAIIAAFYSEPPGAPSRTSLA
jgi:hypothetical protein